MISIIESPNLATLQSYYCLTGVKHCDAFLSTLGADTVTYTEDMVRPAILAMFRRAKFYNKIFTPIGEDQVMNCTSLTLNQHVVSR